MENKAGHSWRCGGKGIRKNLMFLSESVDSDVWLRACPACLAAVTCSDYDVSWACGGRQTRIWRSPHELLTAVVTSVLRPPYRWCYVVMKGTLRWYIVNFTLLCMKSYVAECEIFRWHVWSLTQSCVKLKCGREGLLWCFSPAFIGTEWALWPDILAYTHY